MDTATHPRPSKLNDRVRELKPCPACASFDGLWMERADGALVRCTCLRGVLLEKLDARRVVREEQNL